MYNDIPIIKSVIWTMWRLPIPYRKVILDATRIQRVYPDSGRFLERNWRLLRKTVTLFSSETNCYDVVDLKSFINLLQPFLQSPVSSGFISMLVRYLPYHDESTIDETKETLLRKEIHAALEVYHPAHLNYSFLHGPAYFHIPLHKDIRPSPYLARILYNTFRKRLDMVTHRILVPDLGRKTISTRFSDAYRVFEERYGFPIKTLCDVEAIYIREGIKLGGLTEMRMAWKGNNLNPRIYYARGPDVHFTSSVIQQIFNILLDGFDFVHRRLRFALRDLGLVSDDVTLFIYDYTSFTSSLHEFRYFMEALAEICRGKTVTILDGHNGLIEKDLGDLLSEYNAECNDWPKFDVSSVCEVVDLILNHNTGMLGVPGNISGCTLLHGIFLVFVLGCTLCKVVGDDAIGLFDESEMTRQELLDILKLLGKVAEEKLEFWGASNNTSDDYWKYTKRPISRLPGGVIHQGELVDWPGLSNAVGITCQAHTNVEQDPLRRFHIACKQFCRFRSIIPKFDLTELDSGLIASYTKAFQLHYRVPSEGVVGEIDTRMCISVCPCSFFHPVRIWTVD